jgi:ribonuclease HI
VSGKKAGQNGAGGLLEIYSDGASRGNPGPAGVGGMARDSHGRPVARIFEYLGETTNNVAEYHALICILEEVKDLGYARVRISTDSELVANQVSGGFKVKSAALRPLVARVRALLEPYSRVEVRHIPREKNYECDALANRAIDEWLAGSRDPVLPAADDPLF